MASFLAFAKFEAGISFPHIPCFLFPCLTATADQVRGFNSSLLVS